MNGNGSNSRLWPSTEPVHEGAIHLLIQPENDYDGSIRTARRFPFQIHLLLHDLILFPGVLRHQLHVWGEYALFHPSRDEGRAGQLRSDDTFRRPGILEAIYWKPQMRWNIRSIEVLKPIPVHKYPSQSVGKKATAPTRRVMAGEPGNLGLIIEDERQQRASMLLRDVAYVIAAWSRRA